MTEELLYNVHLTGSEWLAVRAGLLRIKYGLRTDVPLNEAERLEFIAGLKSVPGSVVNLLAVIDQQLAGQAFDKGTAVATAIQQQQRP